MGDLSENSEYTSAKEELAYIDGRIAELEELIQNAKVITPSGNNQVNLGHAVTVQVNGTKVKFFIVGEWEANPGQKKISLSSPLGQALMGKSIGDKIQVDAPAGKILYTIVSIE
jgi:transcription elongation factor GreA